MALIILAGVAVWTVLYYFRRSVTQDVTTPKVTNRINNLWEYAENAIKKQRFNLAEKALLGILKADNKNTAAYNRLGMLYARQQNYDDAIECFDIASSLAPTVAILYNLGLVHYEKGQYQQAAHALEKVIDLEPTTKRYVAYAKALHKLKNYKQTIEVLKKAIEEDPSPKYLEFLAETYESAKQYENAEDIRRQLAIATSEQGHLDAETQSAHST